MTRLSSKGQITIPKNIRESLGIKAGDKVTFSMMPDGTVILCSKSKSLADLAGIFYKEGMTAVPIEKMNIGE